MSGQAETAAEDVSRLESVLQDMSAHQNARARPDVSPMSREELEDRFLRLYEESLLFKQHVNKQEDKIKKLGTKLMKLVKDRGRMEQLAAGGSQSVSKARNVEMEMMLEELQEKVRGLQTENEGLKQRLLVAKQQVMNSQSSMPRPYRHVQSRVNSGLKRREESPSPSHSRPGLVEEARARIRNLENVIESQQSHMEEMEAELEQLREELQTTQAAYEGRLQQAQQINKLRSHVNNNVAQIKLQKQLTEKSNAVTVLEGHLQEHKQTLKEAIQKLDELSEQLKHEKLKNGDLENRLQICTNKLELLPQQLSEVEQERDQLKESYNKLMDSIFDVSQQQKWQTQEQQLKLQIVQLETALKADLNDKNLILQKLKAEREIHEKLAGENKKLQIQFLDQKQEMDELRARLKLHSRETEPHKERHDLSFLEHVEEGGSRSNTESRIQELQAAHAETILELEKTRHLLSTENKISNDYKAELEAVQQKMDSDKVSYEQKLEHKTQLLDTSTAKIKKLEAQLREIAYNPKAHVHRPDVTNEVGADESNETVHLEPGENLIELQIICASLSPSLLEALHDNEPYTFCTYGFYTSKLHSTPVVMGHRPQYGYTSKYVVSMDDGFQDYVSRGSVTVELHQALGTDWRTLASGQLPLQQLLKQDEKVHGTIQLVGSGAELGTVGSVDYWMRLRNPATDSGRGLQDKLKPGGFIGSEHTSTVIFPSKETEPHKERHDLSFLEHVEEGGSRSNTESRIQELQAAHAETILELEKTRHLLSTENKISNDYKAELEAVQQKMDSDKVSYEQKLEHKTQLLDTSTAKIKKLEAQLREIAYNPKAHVHRPDVTNEVGADESNETVHLEPGENLIELQIICASLSPSLLEALHDNEPYTFCTYGFYTSKLHSTPVVMGHRPQYGYTSKYVVSMDDGFQDYVSRGSVTVELHQALGTDWRTLASGQLPLQQLLKQDEKVHGTIQLVGSGAELGTVGSVDYWMRLRNPATDSGRGLQDKLKPGGFIGSAPNTPAQALPPLPKLKQETQAKDAVVSKKVTFGYPSPATQLVEDSSASHLGDKTTPSPVMKPVTPAPSKAEDDEDEFLLSAGQLLSSVSQSNSDVSEEISEDVEAAKQDPGESTQSDSDDCIVHGQATGRKASERVRVEVVSLSLRAESRVARDTSVMRLFVEYSLLDLPTEETPLSLPKPAQGRSINFNYSKVVPVDAESNAARRRLLREVLRGQRPQMERIRFTVVSEPPEEEEQDRECEDVGVAFLRIADILDRRQDLTEASLSVVDVLDSSEVVGSLTVSVEGLEALQAIMEDQDQDAASVSFLPLST